MDHPNAVTFKLSGRFALFSDPVTRVGGEKCSYLVPTYEALKGICESIYWKPTFLWVVDRVRVLKAFRSQSKGIRPIRLDGGPSTLSIYTYLCDVEYQVQAHFEWNTLRPELEKDRNENKHFFMTTRSIEKGGRRDIFLGTRECQGYVEPETFGSGVGEYDTTDEMSFGLMFHGFDYGDEGEGGQLTARLWYPRMRNGVIEFCRPEECTVRRTIKPMDAKRFMLGENLRPVEEECP